MTVRKIEDLVVYAYGMYPVEISRGKQVSSTKRVKLKAAVDSQTGEEQRLILKQEKFHFMLIKTI